MDKGTFKRLLPLVLVLMWVAAVTTGCAWWKDLWESKKMARGNAEALYAAGVEAYKDGRYKRAVEHFTRVKELYPLHPLAPMAEIGIGDAHFSNEDYAEAEMAYTEFANLHPSHEDIPYVLYQIGMCHYHQMLSIDRDQTETMRAAKEFERVIARYPTSKFAFLAEKRLKECRQRLAESEFYVGEFYFKRGDYKAALRRFEYLAKNYPNVGLDYKTSIYLKESKERLAREEERKAEKERREKEKKAREEALKKAKESAAK
ncbi:MAG TPA: outer membrane protein assembly factor BamD [Syntrophales bacterium]|nr:outer membrane protein assembly factor BamD [Syntrophales bacterium]HOM06389.1 outer membrane protein assembly factor BamD [Syntrophales bacterium]HPQ05931.1 outer membrane protein assembly factor BamD [Syntrophales bacterium]